MDKIVSDRANFFSSFEQACCWYLAGPRCS